MVIARSEMTVESREKARGGEGVVQFVHFVAGKGEAQVNTNLLSEITFPPGASIGYHAHNDETEFFIITEGAGLVNDNGKEVAVKAGDVVVTGGGASHSIANRGSVPLKLIAAIIKG